MASLYWSYRLTENATFVNHFEWDCKVINCKRLKLTTVRQWINEWMKQRSECYNEWRLWASLFFAFLWLQTKIFHKLLSCLDFHLVIYQWSTICYCCHSSSQISTGFHDLARVIWFQIVKRATVTQLIIVFFSLCLSSTNKLLLSCRKILIDFEKYMSTHKQWRILSQKLLWIPNCSR